MRTYRSNVPDQKNPRHILPIKRQSDPHGTAGETDLWRFWIKCLRLTFPNLIHSLFIFSSMRKSPDKKKKIEAPWESQGLNFSTQEWLSLSKVSNTAKFDAYCTRSWQSLRTRGKTCYVYEHIESFLDPNTAWKFLAFVMSSFAFWQEYEQGRFTFHTTQSQKNELKAKRMNKRKIRISHNVLACTQSFILYTFFW